MPAPIVLAHGLLGFYHMTVDRFIRAAYFGGIKEAFQAAGHLVIVPNVPGMASIEKRAAALAEQIDRQTKSPFFLIGHSMGGLDARHLITHLGFGRRVIALATVASPHRGSFVGDWVFEQLGRRLRGLRLLSRLGVEHDALAELVSPALDEFNARTPDHPGVTYVSVAGAPTRCEVCPFLRLPYRIIEKYDGANDGLVPVRSAKWGRFLGTWPIDHITQVNLPTGARCVGARLHDPIPYYRALLSEMVRLSNAGSRERDSVAVSA